jgi:hypothetical protein
MRFSLFCLLFVIASSALAEQKMGLLDKSLFIQDWDGAPQFVKKIEQEKHDVCTYLSGAEVRFKDTPYVIRRIVLALAHTDCAQKKSIVEKYISTKEVVLLSTVIDTAATLQMSERKKIQIKIQTIKNKEKDPLVQEAATRFMASVK